MVIASQVQLHHNHENSFVSVDDSITVILVEDEDDVKGVKLNIARHSQSLSTLSISHTSMLNTQTSILDLTKEEDDDDYDDEEQEEHGDSSSVLFHDLAQTADPFCRLQEDVDALEGAASDLRQEEEEKEEQSRSLLGRFSPDQFFDSLCSTSTGSSRTRSTPRPNTSRNSTLPETSPCSPVCLSRVTYCITAPSSTNSQDELEPFQETANTTINSTAREMKVDSNFDAGAEKAAGKIHNHECVLTNPPSTISNTRLQVEHEIWNLLGCAWPPDVMEVDTVWNLTTTTAAMPRKPCSPNTSSVSSHPNRKHHAATRASFQHRVHRLSRLRQHRWAGATRHGVTVTLESQHARYSPSIPHTVSMDLALEAKDYSHWTATKTLNDHGNAIGMNLSGFSLADAIGMGIIPMLTTYVDSNSNKNKTNNIGCCGNSKSTGVDNQTIASSGEADGYDSDPENLGIWTSARKPTTTFRRVTVEDESIDDSTSPTNYSHITDSPHRMRYSVATVDSHHHHQHSHPLLAGDESVASSSGSTDDADFIFYETVQQTLNSTWTLIWYPNAENIKEFNLPPVGGACKPLLINIWMERGTVVPHNGVVIEPMLMWRDAYQAELQTRKRLNVTSQKPWQMRLLNTCRIAPAFQYLTSRHGQDKYPLARKANCFLIKTVGGKEFILETQSADQASSICEKWKMCVARFASLAVTEDIDAIAHEFFHPTLSAQTLTVQSQARSQQQEYESLNGEGIYVASSLSDQESSVSGTHDVEDCFPIPQRQEVSTTDDGGVNSRRWLDI